MRIVYIIDSLAHTGGAERIISEKMNYLAELGVYDVYVITCYQFPQNCPNSYYLSEKVKQVDLCIPVYQQYKYKYPKRLFVKWRFYRRLYHKLEKAVDSINPDILIGMSYELGNVVCNIKCKAAKIIESHEARVFTMSGLQYKTNPFFNKIYRCFYLRTIEKNADVVVTLTHSNALEWRKAKRVEIIPNFSSMSITKISDCETKRIISVGRLEWQKGYDRLIDVWKIVSKKYPDWKLDIYGKGTLELELRNIIKKTELDNISIHHFTKDICTEYINSSICVLTSRFEGFSLVLLEALRHGLPCVTFNCPFGPEDVIDNNKCGYVVENGNIKLFADKLCFLMKNIETRKAFSKAAIEKASLYNKDSIMQQWDTLFKSLSTR